MNHQPTTIDWRELAADQRDESATNMHLRLRWLLGLAVLALGVVFARAVQLELRDGAAFRRLAARPVVSETPIAATRGRIVTRDGVVLAEDRLTRGLAVEFRRLEQPLQPQWLRNQARSRLPKAKRRDAASLAAMEEQVRRETAELNARLAQVCGIPIDEWLARSERISRRVNQMATLVNQRRLEQFRDSANDAPPVADELSAWSVLAGLFAPPTALPPPRLTIAEETAWHCVVDDLSADAIAEIESHPKLYPGVQVVEYARREYPAGMLAAHLVGHVSASGGVNWLVVPREQGARKLAVSGALGAERWWEESLAGTSGLEARWVDDGELHVQRTREPADGRELALSIDGELQRAAETWLDRVLRPRETAGGDALPAAQSGAIVALDVRSGEILLAASAPRFDPGWLAAGDARAESLLSDRRQPLFDRALRMALPPGSVFKPLTAIALLAEGRLDPQAAFRCQGFLDDPDRMRCQIFRQHGIGHADVTLADALAQSCNVYFFHHVAAIGGVKLLEWAERFEFGRPGTLGLAGDSRGHLPAEEPLRRAGQAQLLAIGQGSLTATPLEVARLYAAIANGGYLVTPSLTPIDVSGDPATIRGVPVVGVDESVLAAVREGLRRTIDDPNGTAHDSLRSLSISVAGKTGTAETGGERGDHAWFAGYVPADEPRYAFVVVLEHGGSGGTAAGALARNLVLRMQDHGYLPRPQAAEKPFPPGKG